MEETARADDVFFLPRRCPTEHCLPLALQRQNSDLFRVRLY